MLIDKKTRKHRKLSLEILGLVAIIFIISLFLFQLLTICAVTIVERYCHSQDIIITETQYTDIYGWVINLSLLVSLIFFIFLFLFLLGERLSYIRDIIKGIEAMRKGQLNYEIPLEGNNELSQLAKAVNYLSVTQKNLKEKEQKINKEKEDLIHALSHDIRTPLTSIMSYSEFLITNENCTIQERNNYLELICKKGEQIKELTDILLNGSKRNLEYFDNARFLLEQLADEFKDTLEDEFNVTIDLSGCPPFAGNFDVQELRRIFDNLSSNIQKYAETQKPVTLTAILEEECLIIKQENHIKFSVETIKSYQMGLNSIRRILHSYRGQLKVSNENDIFRITVVFSDF